MGHAPEDEAARLQIETEIYELEHSPGNDEWPDEVAA
jgi:hypothetical protein